MRPCPVRRVRNRQPDTGRRIRERREQVAELVDAGEHVTRTEHELPRPGPRDGGFELLPGDRRRDERPRRRAEGVRGDRRTAGVVLDPVEVDAAAAPMAVDAVGDEIGRLRREPAGEGRPKAFVRSKVWPGTSGTNTWSPSEPDVFTSAVGSVGRSIVDRNGWSSSAGRPRSASTTSGK